MGLLRRIWRSAPHESWPIPMLVSKERITSIPDFDTYRGIPVFYYEDETGRHLWPKPKDDYRDLYE
jgi:hypothetical protein